MGLDALLAMLENRDSVTSVTSVTLDDVTPEPACIKACTPVTPVTCEKTITASDEAAMLPRNAYRETRRQKVLAMLEAAPDTQRAIYADTDSDPHNVILTVAVRHVATCEMLVSKTKFDPWQLLELVEQHGQATH